MCIRDSDCFYTILSRKVSPEYVFKLWVKEFINFFDLKQKTEEICAILDTVDHEKVKSISQLAKHLKDKLYIKKVNFIEILVQLMVNTECRVTYVNYEVYQLLSKAKQLNKKLILISDYYLPETQLNQILKFHQLQNYFSKIFVSCDYNACLLYTSRCV